MNKLTSKQLKQLSAKQLENYINEIGKWCKSKNIDNNIIKSYNDLIKKTAIGWNMQLPSNKQVSEQWVKDWYKGKIKGQNGQKYTLKQRLLEIIKIRKIKEDKRVLAFHYVFLAYCTGSKVRQIESAMRVFENKNVVERKAGNGGKRLKKETRIAFAGNLFKYTTYFLLDHNQTKLKYLREELGFKAIIKIKLTYLNIKFPLKEKPIDLDKYDPNSDKFWADVEINYRE